MQNFVSFTFEAFGKTFQRKAKVMSSKKGVEFLKKVVDFSTRSSDYDSVLLKTIRLTSGGNGRCTAEFTVTKEHLNFYGGIHGGCAATIIDNVTTYALMTTHPHPGVTVDLYVNYLRKAKEGDELIVDASTVKVGKKIAFLDCVLKSKRDGSIVAKGGQTKFVDFEDEMRF